ncbi:MAG TPA: FAD/NAD(P)-binding oxidoreductase [Solirubrobacteraceae bacterium]
MPAAEPEPGGPLRVIVVGGGVAALEATLTLAELAGERVQTRVIAPNRDFLYRPLAVLDLFRGVPAERFPIRSVTSMVGAELRPGRLGWVTPNTHRVHLVAGEILDYDALLLCPGADPRVAFRHAVTIGMELQVPRLRAVIRELENGTCQDLGLIVPPRRSWLLPLYEFALLARRVSRARITIISTDPEPMRAFGDGVSRRIRELLAEHDIDLLGSASASVPDPRHVQLTPEPPAGRRRGHDTRMLGFDRVVSLPELVGSHIRGLPAAPGGFLPVDRHCRVPVAGNVFAAGDGTSYPVKHGGVAAQHAQAAARSIARLAGVTVATPAFSPALEALLFGGEAPLWLGAQLIGGQASRSRFQAAPGRTEREKLAAPHLAEALVRLRPAGSRAPGSGASPAAPTSLASG